MEAYCTQKRDSYTLKSVTEGGDIGGHNEAEDDSLEYEDDENARLLDVCIDGDVEDLVALLEEMAANGETLNEEMLNYPDQSGRVSARTRGGIYPSPS